MKLNATAVKQAKPREKQYKLSDGKGMYLLVTPNGAKYWRLKYRFADREKSLALGVYPDITLAEARSKRDAARKALANDTDPAELKKCRKRSLREESDNCFKHIAIEWFNTRMRGRSKSHSDRTLRALHRDLFPLLGSRPISQITAPEVLSALRRIEARGAIETAHRVKQIAAQIFRYAVATGRSDRDPTVDLRGALMSPKKRHLASITDPEQVGQLLIAIEGYSGTPVVKAALLLSPLLFCRPGEIRHMEWLEVNWDEDRWEIPAEKMKMKLPHIVPLARQAKELLWELRPFTGGGRYVFPSARGPTRPLSENGVRTALRTLGYTNDTMTPHGFRAMARTLLDEALGFRVDWIEHQLAHAVRDANGRAYNRTSHLAGRFKMMQVWADYLDELKDQQRTTTSNPKHPTSYCNS